MSTHLRELTRPLSLRCTCYFPCAINTRNLCGARLPLCAGSPAVRPYQRPVASTTSCVLKSNFSPAKPTCLATDVLFFTPKLYLPSHRRALNRMYAHDLQGANAFSILESSSIEAALWSFYAGGRAMCRCDCSTLKQMIYYNDHDILPAYPHTVVCAVVAKGFKIPGLYLYQPKHTRNTHMHSHTFLATPTQRTHTCQNKSRLPNHAGPASAFLTPGTVLPNSSTHTAPATATNTPTHLSWDICSSPQK